MPFTSSLPAVPFSTITNPIVTGAGTGAAFYAATILTPNAGRKEAVVTVVGSGAPLYVCLGPVADQTQFHYILNASTTNYGGNGGSVTVNKWLGPISVSGSANLLFKYWEAV